MEKNRKAINLSEKQIIDIFYSLFGISPRSAIPFGDDVAAVEVKNGRLAVLKTDMFVRKTDAPKGMSYRQMGRKAVIATVSDLAAKGVIPLVLLSSVAFPTSFTSEDIEELAKGMNDGSKENDTFIIGGDTNEADDLIIDIIGFGLIDKTKIILRSGAKPGDILATTGSFGETAAGLRVLKNDIPIRNVEKDFLKAVYMPKAQLKEGVALSKSGTLTASIDSSDGLAWSIHELSRSSHVGFHLVDIPLSKDLLEFGKNNKIDPLELALYGGEEYNLVVTIKKKSWNEASKAVSEVGGKLYKIGYATKDLRVSFNGEGKSRSIEAVGWEHFISKI